jgi:hypothetical protein
LFVYNKLYASLTKYLFTILILNTILTFSQTKVDSLIIDIYKKSFDNRIVIRPSESKLLITYKLCDDWRTEIDYLKKELTEKQIQELENDENGTFNLIGLLSNLERNNSKRFGLKQLEKLEEAETKMISIGCGDVFSTMTLYDYYLKLLTEKNNFIIPEFKFTAEELKLLRE